MPRVESKGLASPISIHAFLRWAVKSQRSFSVRRGVSGPTHNKRHFAIRINLGIWTWNSPVCPAQVIVSIDVMEEPMIEAKGWVGIGLVMNAMISSAPGADAPWKTYLTKPDDWYRGQAGRTVAANVLSYQSDQGSWPKNLDTTAESYTGERRLLQGTFDNGATVNELRFLARAYRAARVAADRDAFLKGLDHVVRAQYPNGGWPQFFPPGKGYHRHVTFNDGAMVNILEFLTDVAHSLEFSFVDEARRSKSEQSFRSGIECILKCQIKVDGKLTIWCAQHDEKTFEPRWGRSFEPPSLTSSESAGILRLLMSQDNPSPEIKQAIHAGARWFAEARINGIRQVHVNGDKVIVKDKDAAPLWSRFCEIGTNRPIFCGRDGIIKYDVARIEAERRNGYAWYGSWGNDVASRYARWKEKWDMNVVPAR
jgi:PelA/Pel-15E family pectate lyase